MLSQGWSYVGVDHMHEGGAHYTHYIIPDSDAGSHLLTMDLAAYGLEDVLRAVHAWTGLLPSQCTGVFFSPPCTTYGQGSNQCSGTLERSKGVTVGPGLPKITGPCTQAAGVHQQGPPEEQRW